MEVTVEGGIRRESKYLFLKFLQHPHKGRENKWFRYPSGSGRVNG